MNTNGNDPRVKSLTEARFYDVPDIMKLFAFKTRRAVWRAAGPGGFLAPYRREFTKRHLLFERAGVDALIDSGSGRA